ncbi:MAG: helix-turn-helix transcriptional regulator [Pseudomonadota bacterium]
MIRFFSLSQVFQSASWRLNLLHSHPYHRLIWVKHGQTRALLGSKLQGVGAHNLLFIPANRPFFMEAGSNMQGHLLSCEPADLRLLSENVQHLRVRELVDQSEASALFDAILREQSLELSFNGEAQTAYTDLLSVWILRQIESQKDAETRPTAAENLISGFLNVLEQNYSSGQSMADYAKSLNVTPTHLSRVCKSELEKSAADLITDRTLFAARVALETTNTPAKDIAEMLGFGSAAYFSRFILTHSGQSPRALRTSAKERRMAAA